MRDYPDDLPCVSRIDGYAMQGSSAVLRAPFGAGASHQRRTHRQMPMQMQIAWRVDNPSLDPLFQWLNLYGYDWFNIDLSGIESSALDQFKSPMAIRLITDLNIALIRIHRQNWYLVSTSAEYYPPVAVRAYVVPLFLSISPGLHAHHPDNVTLVTPNVILSIHSADHAHLADNVTLISSVTSLIVADGVHAHHADNIVLPGIAVSLAVNDASHAHAADNVVTAPFQLSINEAFHAHTTDPVALNTLGINEALHGHSADNLTLGHTP